MGGDRGHLNAPLPHRPRWPRLKAAEQAERSGLRTVAHAYIDVTDKGENLVCKLGLQTVPTHVLVNSSGQVRAEPPPSSPPSTPFHPDEVTMRVGGTSFASILTLG